LDLNNRALELDPDYADIHFNNATFGFWTEWNWEKGEQEFLKALAINPNDAMYRVFYAHLLSILQRGDEALLQGSLAVELDPFNPTIQSMYGAVLAQNGNWEASLLHLEKALVIDPGHYLAYNLLDNVAYHCGEYDEVFEAFRNSLPFEEEFYDSIQTIYQEKGFEIAYEEVLHRMELQGGILPSYMASRYRVLDQYEKVLDWLERGYEIHDHNMPYILTRVTSYDSLYDHPRFIAIVEKMNLPLPPK
jgi:serine/threonine-protein kinase